MTWGQNIILKIIYGKGGKRFVMLKHCKWTNDFIMIKMSLKFKVTKINQYYEYKLYLNLFFSVQTFLSTLLLMFISTHYRYLFVFLVYIQTKDYFHYYNWKRTSITCSYVTWASIHFMSVKLRLPYNTICPSLSFCFAVLNSFRVR